VVQPNRPSPPGFSDARAAIAPIGTVRRLAYPVTSDSQLASWSPAGLPTGMEPDSIIITALAVIVVVAIVAMVVL
jgi:hypothetical protein